LDAALQEITPILSAVAELRFQAKEGVRPDAPPYPGRHATVDPLDFLKEHYGTAIAEGRLRAGQLSLIDNKLYYALRRSLQPNDDGTQIQALFDTFKPVEKQGRTPYRLRLEACADLLGVDLNQASQFFRTIRREPRREGDRTRC